LAFVCFGGIWGQQALLHLAVDRKLQTATKVKPFFLKLLIVEHTLHR